MPVPSGRHNLSNPIRRPERSKQMAATGVRPIESLRPHLHGLEGKDYAAYQSVRGSYAYNRFQLHVDQIPMDPYAPLGTGVFRVSVLLADAGFPDAYCAPPIRCIAFRDFLARQFHTACGHLCLGRRGTGNSGLIAIAEPHQEILDGRRSTSTEAKSRCASSSGFLLRGGASMPGPPIPCCLRSCPGSWNRRYSRPTLISRP